MSDAERKSERKPRFWHTLSFRLNFWYTAIFTASTLMIVAFLYVMMSLAIERKDREVLQAKADEFVTVFRTAGLSGLQRYVDSQAKTRGGQAYFVRVISNTDKIILVAVPDEWIQANIEELDLLAAANRFPISACLKMRNGISRWQRCNRPTARGFKSDARQVHAKSC
jgi:hypothetical protein